MSALNPVALLEKLGKLNASQQSIETLSQWCIFFRKDAGQIVELWDREFSRTQDINKMLALIYLANDILQNSRKKGPQFVNELFTKLPSAVLKLVKAGGSEVRSKMVRMVKVWEERRVFGSSGVGVFNEILGPPAVPPAPSTAGRKRGNIVLQTNDPSVNSLSSSMQEADEAHSRSVRLDSQTSTVLRAEESQGGAEQVKASIKSLQLQTVALENEIGHRNRVIRILEDLLSQQTQLKDSAEEQWQKHHSALEERQQRTAVTATGSINGKHGNEAPATASPASQPPPPMGSPPMQDPRDPRRRKVDAQPASLPDVSEGAVDGALPQPGQGAAPTAADGGNSAADLVAQLSQTGMSTQMLLDALAALPGGNADSSPLPVAVDDDEYDPELGA